MRPSELDSSDLIEPSLFYQQQVYSTTSQQSQKTPTGGSNQIQLLTSKKRYGIPKISKPLLQSSFIQKQSIDGYNQEQLPRENIIKRSITPTLQTTSIQKSILKQNNQDKDEEQKLQQINLKQRRNINTKILKSHNLSVIGQESNSYVYHSQKSQLDHVQISSGEDISFNVDCSQAFQNMLSEVQAIERPVTVGDITQQKIIQRENGIFDYENHQTINHFANNSGNPINNMITQTTTIGSRDNQASYNNENSSHITQRVQDSLNNSENLETSRFSSTLENHIIENGQIFNYQHGQQQQEVNQPSRICRVAPNVSQIKKGMISQANQLKLGQIVQMQKQNHQGIILKSRQDTGGFSNGQYQTAGKTLKDEQLRQLKQEIEKRKDQQIKRQQEMQTLDPEFQLLQQQQQLLNSQQQQMTQNSYLSQNGPSYINTNNTEIKKNNVYIVNAQFSSHKKSSKKKRSHKKQQQQRHDLKNKVISSIKKSMRDRSADNQCYMSDSSSSFSSQCSSCQQSNCDQSDCNCSCSCSDNVPSSRQSRLMNRKVFKEGDHNESRNHQQKSYGGKKGIIKKHKNGKYQLQLKDEQSNQIYKINAPNEMFFNENLSFQLEDNKKDQQTIIKMNQKSEDINFNKLKQQQIGETTQVEKVFSNEMGLTSQKKDNQQQYFNRGRRLEKYNPENYYNLGEMEMEEEEHSIVPIIKRNLTPDDHINKNGISSYVLVDQNNQPKKIYIKRNFPDNQLQFQSPSKHVTGYPSQTISKDNLTSQYKAMNYQDQILNQSPFESTSPNHSNLEAGYNSKKTPGKEQLAEFSGKRSMLMNGGGDQSLICFMSAKGQKQNKYNESDKKKESSRGKCILQ